MGIEDYNKLKDLVDGKTSVYIILGDTDIVERKISCVRLVQEKSVFGIDAGITEGIGGREPMGDLSVSETSVVEVYLSGDSIRVYSPADLYLSYDDAKVELARRISARIDSLVDASTRAGSSITLSEKAASALKVSAIKK